jgi:hypothetical protein
MNLPLWNFCYTRTAMYSVSFIHLSLFQGALYLGAESRGSQLFKTWGSH